MKRSPFYTQELARAICSIPQSHRLHHCSFFITGATGLICSTVVDLLLAINSISDAGISIYVAGRSREAAERRFQGAGQEQGLNFIPYEATSPTEIDLNTPVDYVLHGASNANPAAYLREPVETMLANFVGLNTVLSFARSSQAKRALYISSSEVYGAVGSPEPFSEGDYGFVDILGIRSAYPSSKRAGETLCIAHGVEHDLDTVIVRPGHIYGPFVKPDDNRATAQFTRLAASGQNIVMKSSGTQRRSYCHSIDCATAILSVLLMGASGSAYNISNPLSVCSISDIANAIAAACNVSVTFERPSSGEQASFSTMRNSALASNKLESLGWTPRYNLDQGVDSMINTLREVGLDLIS